MFVLVMKNYLSPRDYKRLLLPAFLEKYKTKWKKKK